MARRIGVASLLAVTVLVVASSTRAFAATTIGSNLAASATSFPTCNPSCTFAQSSLPPASQAAGGVLAPQDGVVVRWRVKTGGGGTVQETRAVGLRIIRPGSSDTRTGAGTGPYTVVPSNEISTYDVRLPIQAGDALGLDCCVNSVTGVLASTPDAVTLEWHPRLEDGVAPRMGSAFPPDSELLINADIEADCDRDGFGDETQDTNLSGCSPAASAPGQRAAAIKKCKKKHPKGSKKRKKCIKKAKKLPV